MHLSSNSIQESNENILDEQGNLIVAYLSRSVSFHRSHSIGENVMQYFMVNSEQATASKFVNKFECLSSVLFPLLVQLLILTSLHLCSLSGRHLLRVCMVFGFLNYSHSTLFVFTDYTAPCIRMFIFCLIL